MENLLHKREKVLQSYVDKAFEVPADEWIRFENFPEDMVLYRYIGNTLQSWVNTFPISNDDIGIPSSWYRIHDLGNKNIFNIPLAFLRYDVQYVSLGPKWYVIKTARQGSMYVIAAIEVMEQYPSENAALENSCNRKLGLNDKFSAVPPYIDGTSVVHTSDGTPVFSVVREDTLSGNDTSSAFRWLALLLATLAIIYYQHTNKGIRTMFFGLGGLLVLQICTSIMVNSVPLNSGFFSPMTYADAYFNSFGALTLFHLFIFLYCAVVFMSRKAVIRNIFSSSPIIRRAKISALSISTILLIGYIHHTFRSLIFNSSINFDLYRINDISYYTVITYFMYSLLALAVLFLLDILVPASSRYYLRKRRRHSKRPVLIYILAVAVYMSGAVGIYGFQKECENIRVLTGRMAIERDLNLEMQLQAMEKSIISDPFIRRLTGNPDYEGIILNRLAERYFYNILPEYDIRLTICNAYQSIKPDEYSSPKNCFRHYEEIINNYGIPLTDVSAFYYLDYFRDYISYLGAFSIFRKGVRYDMYIEIESKVSSDNIGYPSVLLNNPRPLSSIAYPYSVARYHNGRLTSHQGRYNFPVSINVNIYEDGFSHYFYRDNVVFINKLPGTNLIAVSRPARGLFPSLISFSYLFLLLALVVIGIPALLKKRHKESLLRPKRSFRMKMTIFITAFTVIALIMMAIGSVVIIIGYMDTNNSTMMEEKVLSVQNTLAQISKNTDSYSELSAAEILSVINDISRSAQMDINIYDPKGRLIHTTKPEVFNEYLLSTRMNSEAFYELAINKRTQVMQEEHISALSYYSLYTPVYNSDGRLIAIANIPYFISETNFEYDTSPIVAAIINLYILFIIAATRPLKEINRNMLEMDITHKAEHINYKADDELGLLVRTYNKMIDDLDRSTRELAQNEREKAWSEMARQIAHEIKNPLTPMKISIQHLVFIKKQGNPEWKDRFDALASMLIEQIDILSNTASEFSSFAKLYQEEQTEVDLVEILSEQEVLFNNRENIEMNFRSQVEKAVVLARKEQITRTFVNLITNAIQAVENKENGIINITLRVISGYYQVDVEDNGEGVSKDNMEKLFHPNFTTKTRGSGLGLAICKSIITQSHGEINYYQSASLGGADFSVRLPVHTVADDDNT